MMNEQDIIYKIALRHLRLPETPEADFIDAKSIATYYPDGGCGNTYIVTFVFTIPMFNQYTDPAKDLQSLVQIVKVDDIDTTHVANTLYSGFDGIRYVDDAPFNTWPAENMYEDLEAELYEVRCREYNPE